MPERDSTLRIALIGLASLVVAVGIGRFAFTPLLPMMLPDGVLTIPGGGLLATVHFVGYLMGALTAARVPISPRALLPASLIAIGLATLAMGLFAQFWLWLALRWIAGVASAWVLVLVGTHCVNALAEAGREDRQGWVFSGVGAGIAIAGLGCIAMMAGDVSSDVAWLIFGVLALAVAAAIRFGLGPEVPAARPSRSARVSERTPIVWSAVLAYGAAGLGYVVPGTYLPAMAREIVPSPWIFGWGWPVFGAAAFLSTLASAALHRRFSNRQIWGVSQVAMAVGLLLPVMFPHILSIVAAGLCVGGTFMVITMAGLREAHRIAGSADAVRHVAAMTATFAAGQTVGPVFAGALYDATASFTPSLIATAILLVSTGALLARKAPVVHRP
ncbi:MAG: YbfB/YjiJ family MFS transporter [Rhodospirillales bacterium]|nr:YbfB/YjiJ family MFS transporter [Rhodospirillales bacterium]